MLIAVSAMASFFMLERVKQSVILPQLQTDLNIKIQVIPLCSHLHNVNEDTKVY